MTCTAIRLSLNFQEGRTHAEFFSIKGQVLICAWMGPMGSARVSCPAVPVRGGLACTVRGDLQLICGITASPRMHSMS